MNSLERMSREARASTSDDAAVPEQLLVEELILSQSGGKNCRSVDIQAISRRVQRIKRIVRADIASTICGEQEERLAQAALHLWRAKMHVQLSNLYSEKSWDGMKFPRKYFLKYRGFGPMHERSDLVHFRKLFLQCALPSAERACDLAPFSYECVMLKACILCLLIGFGGYMSETHCEKALVTCRRAMTLHRMPQIADDRERAILYNSAQDRTSADASVGARSDTCMGSLWDMAIFAAHLVAEKRGGWDADTLWADRHTTTSPLDTSTRKFCINELPIDSLEELVAWNMWGSKWPGLEDKDALQDILTTSADSQ